uniref:Uncharacterized protein n=1 Tax=Cacopsylla melanoneura TaxID=428564 RepID=A0A8D8M3R5_9HEMI
MPVRNYLLGIIKKEELLTLYALYIYRVIMFIRTYDSSKIALNSEINPYNYKLRSHEYDLYVAFSRTAKTANSVFNVGPRLYNRLPAEMKTLDSNLLHTKLKVYLAGLCLYSMDEYLK